MTFHLNIPRAAGWLGLAAAAIGLTIWLGHATATDPLGFARAEAKPMAAALSLSLFLSGSSFWFLTRGGPKWLAPTAAIAAFAATTFQFILYTAAVTAGGATPAFPRGSVHLMVVAAALFLAGRNPGPKRRQIIQVLAVLILSAAIASLFLLALNRATDGEFAEQPRVGSHLAVGTLLIGLGLLVYRDGGRLSSTLLAPTPTGAITRRLFFGLIVTPPAIGVVLLALLHFEVVGLVLGVGLFTVALTLSGVVVALLSIRAATELDASREHAESARLQLMARLQEQTAQLQETVAHRTRELEAVNANLRAAAEANARLALVASHATNGVAICDAHGNIDWVNAAFERVTGYAAVEMRGQALGDFLRSPGAGAAISLKLRQALDRGESCNVELLSETKAGAPYWSIVDLQPVRDPAGRLVNFIGVQTDISEQRRIQASLEAANRRMLLATDAAGLGVWEGDFAADRCDWDDRMLAIYGLTRAEFGGSYADWVKRLHPDDAESAQQSLEQIQKGQAPTERTFRIVRASDGAVRLIRARVIARRDAAGRLLGCTGAELDITVERENTRQLQELNERLQLALASSSFGVWDLDVPSGRMSWDEKMFSIYGVRREDFTGFRKDFLARIHPDDHRAATGAEQMFQPERQAYTTNFRIVRPDGAVRSIESFTRYFKDAAGQTVRMVGINRDITEERAASQRLIELNERLQLALRSSRYGVWATDLATGKMNWDDRMLEIYGIARENFDGQRATWINSIHPEDRDVAVERVTRIARGEETAYSNEFRIVRPDGTVRHMESHGQLETDSAGRPFRLVGLNRDVSLERKTEAALHLIEERWQLALEGNNDGVWDWDITSGHFFYDTRYSAMLGYALGELPNHRTGHERLVHPDDRADFETINRAHLDGDLPYFQHEHRLLGRAGEWVWVLNRGKVVNRSPEGRPLRMVGTHTDITVRKQLEQRLRQAEELSRQVGQLAQIGGWELRLDSRLLTFSEGVRAIHELPGAQQPDLERTLEFFDPEARAVLRSALFSRTTEEPTFDLELPFTSATGRRLRVRVIGRADFREGRPVMVRGALQDITARHESENARRELEGQLFQAQKMETLGTLAGGIAHDFNNLLTGIIGYHELATDTIPEDHPARACLNEARGASMRARDLVEQILTFSRQSAGEEHEAVDLTLVIREAGRFLRATLAANVAIETTIPEDTGRVLANTTQIYQVLLNLGSNAAHAMRPNGGILRIGVHAAEIGSDRSATLSSAAPGRYLRVDVSDTGHGMDEQTLRRIFDPFFTTKNSQEGTGLGLAVVHGIIRAHRGAIDVTSVVGEGTVFRIYLPVAEQSPPVSPRLGEQPPAGRGQSIFVVDDEELVGRFITLALAATGYRVRCFNLAEACLAAIDEPDAHCDLLLTDQTMPGMQGTELAAAIQKRRPNLPVIVMSGYFSKVPTQSLGELRHTQLLAKPFTTDELAHTVGHAFRDQP